MLRKFVILAGRACVVRVDGVLQCQHGVADDDWRDDEYQRRPQETATFAQLQQLGTDHGTPGGGRPTAGSCRHDGQFGASEALGDLQEALLEGGALRIELVDDDALGCEKSVQLAAACSVVQLEADASVTRMPAPLRSIDRTALWSARGPRTGVRRAPIRTACSPPALSCSIDPWTTTRPRSMTRPRRRSLHLVQEVEERAPCGRRRRSRGSWRQTRDPLGSRPFSARRAAGSGRTPARQPEPLAHAERETAHAPSARRTGQLASALSADALARFGHADCRGDPKVLAAGQEEVEAGSSTIAPIRANTAPRCSGTATEEPHRS